MATAAIAGTGANLSAFDIKKGPLSKFAQLCITPLPTSNNQDYPTLFISARLLTRDLWVKRASGPRMQRVVAAIAVHIEITR
jgi:hypothetical protein